MVRGWSLVHRWSSLICTLFLLMLCLTGLPLIFSAEIDRAFDRTAYDPPQAGRAAPSLDRLIAMGRRLHPGQEVISLYADDDAPVITLRMAPSLKAWHERPALEHLLQFDAHSGRLLREGSRSELARRSPTAVLLALHRSLFAGLPGELFLGVMGCFLWWRWCRVWCCMGPSPASCPSARCAGIAARAGAGWIGTICWGS